MTKNKVKKIILGAINFEKQPNLNKVTIIFSDMFKSGFQVNF